MISSLTDAEEIDLSGCDNIREDDLPQLYTKCKKLKRLNVSGIGGPSIFAATLMDFAGVELTFTNSVGDEETQVVDLN